MMLQTAKADLRVAAPEGPGQQTDLASYLTPGRFSLILLLLIIASFPEVVLGAKTFMFRDYSLFGYPLAHYNRDCFWRGEIPLWNPFNNSGIPYLAQWNTMVFYPLNLVYLLLPMPWSLGWFCLLHILLAGLGMYLLSFRWTADRLAASVAGIAYAFSGLALASLIWPNDVAALGLLPWVWLAVERAWNEGGRQIPKAILIGATQMLSGAPEVILFTWMVIAAVYGLQLWNARGRRGQLLARFGAIISLVACLSAIQLLPFLDLLRHSHRDSGVPDAGGSWSMPGWGWANFLVPLFRMTKTSLGVFLQPSQGWTSSYYLGIGVLILALLALLRIRRAIVWLLGLILAASAILALGDNGHLYGWLRAVFPGMSFMRFPVKFVVLTASVTPLLAAFALAHWQKSEGEERRRLCKTGVAAAASALSLIGAILWFSWKNPGDDEDVGTTLINGLTRSLILLLELGAMFGVVNTRTPNRRSLWQGALLSIIWLDLITHAPAQNPVVEARGFVIGLPPIDQMAPRPKFGQSRAALSLRSIDKFHTTIVSNAFESVLGVRMGLYDNCNLLEKIPKLDGFYSLYIPEEQHVRFRLFGSDSIRPALADFLGVSQISLDKNFLEWQSRDTWMPLVTSGQMPAFPDAETTLDLIRMPDFNPRKIVFLPPEAKSRLIGTMAKPAKILKQTVSAHRITVVLEAPSATMVVIAQTYYHLWKAKIDGAPATLFCANHAFQAVPVSAGEHRLELVYSDNNFRVGALISILTLLSCIWFIWRSRRSPEISQILP